MGQRLQIRHRQLRHVKLKHQSFLFPFLDLPTEIRFMIYESLLDKSDRMGLQEALGDILYNDNSEYPSSKAGSLRMSIMRTCKLICLETSTFIYYSLNINAFIDHNAWGRQNTWALYHDPLRESSFKPSGGCSAQRCQPPSLYSYFPYHKVKEISFDVLAPCMFPFHYLEAPGKIWPQSASCCRAFTYAVFPSISGTILTFQ